MSPKENLPEGFRYFPLAIDAGEEARLLDAFASLPFMPYVMRGYEAKRRVVRYDGVPEFLLTARDRVCALAGLDAESFTHALVTEYTVGAQNGWHRDMPQFGPVVAGISLASACRMRFRKIGAQDRRAAIVLDARSAYVMSGESRFAWQHGIAPVAALRYSITFRTVKSRLAPNAAH